MSAPAQRDGLPGQALLQPGGRRTAATSAAVSGPDSGPVEHEAVQRARAAPEGHRACIRGADGAPAGAAETEPADGWIAATARRARAGDSAALLALHRALAPRHAAQVWSAGRRAPGERQGLERADLEQQAFLVLVEALRTWPGAGDFAAWFARAAHWYLRRYTRRWLRVPPATAAPGQAPDCASLAAERVDCATLLAQLPPSERAVVRWRFWQDLTFAQIAVRYGVPPATAHDRYRSALVRLRRLLGLDAAGAPRRR